MARKPRDYKAELERRNARARGLGYSSYRSLRSALERGKVRRNNSGVEFVPSESNPRDPGYKRAGWDTPQEYTQMQRENKDWQKSHSHGFRSSLPPNASPEIQRAYYDAYVRGKNKDRLLDMRHYIVDVLGTMTGKEFDKKYLKK